MWIENVIDSLCNLFLVVLIIRYMGIFFKRKKDSRKILTASALGFYLGTLLVSYVFSVPILNFAVCIIGILAISCAFEGTILQKILITISVAVLNALCDFVCYTLLAGRIQEGQLDISYIFTILLILICEQIISRIMGKRNNVSDMPDRFGIIILIPLCSLGILYVLTDSVSAENVMASVFIMISVLVVNVVVFYLYHVTLENYLSQLQYERVKERSEAYANQLELLAETQHRIQALHHDMKHHIRELQGMANNKELGEINTYLQEMEAAVQIPGEYAHSGNYQIDSLLNYLIGEAKEKLEQVEVNIKLPQNVKLNTFKLNIILGNLLENAIEAAGHSTEKKLSLEITLDKGILFLHVANSYDGVLKKKGTTFLTTKENAENHGIGLKNVQEMVEAENGSFTITEKDGWFVADVMLYITE